MAPSSSAAPPRAEIASVPSVASGEALPVLMRERRSVMRWGVALLSHYKVVEPATAELPAADAYRHAAQQNTSASLAEPRLIDAMKKEGFNYLGRYAFLGYVSWIPRDAWLDEPGTTRLSARRAIASGLEGTMSSFYLSTAFDDGSVVTTWSGPPPPMASSPRWQSRGGTGNLTTTYASHLDAVAEHAARTRARPLRLESLADFVRASKFVEVYVIPDAAAVNIVVTRVLVWGAMLAAIVAGISWLLRAVPLR